MAQPIGAVKRFLFRVIARTAITVYSYIPIFGHLRASVAILRKGHLILIIDRNDGRGFSFPGGLAHLGESAEQAMRREVHEETGLQVGKSNFLFEYRTSLDILCAISVFNAEATGSLVESWEGTPRWLPMDEIRARLVSSQQEALNRIART
ncbi:MAG: NUDIX domain-containing protein [Candidatus Sulfotelmatobacter sp.]